MTDLVIGCLGQIGSALFDVLQPSSDCIRGVDVLGGAYPAKFDKLNFMHVCLPYINEDQFIKTVNDYDSEYQPSIIVIHSTTPVGLTRKLQSRLYFNCMVVHSPVRGQHPNIKEGLLTFTKYVSGTMPEAVISTVSRLRRADIPADFMDNGPESTELAKLMCTTRYGINIAITQEMERMCKQYNVPFDQVYTNWEESYNSGYEKLGKPEVKRPILTPGFIGGHCVMPNIDIISKQYSSKIFDFVKESNTKKAIEK